MPEPTICIRRKLFKDGRSLLAAEQLGIPVEHFVGCLIKLWVLGEEVAKPDGSLHGWREEKLDEYVGVNGFCHALSLEWLQRGNGVIILPNYKTANPVGKKPKAKPKGMYSIQENDPPLPFQDKAFLELWADWVECRRASKKPLTQQAVKLQIKKMTEIGLARTLAALEASIAGQWQGLYEPRESQRNGQPVRSDSRVHSKGGYGASTLRVGNPDPPF